MPPTKRAKRPPSSPSPSPARAVDAGRLVIRGLTADDHAALARAVERRREALAKSTPGATLSQNAVCLSLLREALSADAAASVKP